MKLTDFILTPDWVLDLDLLDKEEKLFCLIWSYSRNGRSRWRGTAPELAAWLRCSHRHAKRLIYDLEARGLIDHEVVYDRRERHNITEFWAVIPGSGTPSIQGTRERICWSGRGDIHVPNGRDADVPNGRDIHVPNHIDTTKNRSSNIQESGSSNTPLPPKGGFVPPTVEEVAAYAKDNGFADPQGFAAYYVAYQSEAGWITGKGSKTKPIDNWKLNVLAWGKYSKNEIFSQQPAPAASEPVSMSPEEFDSLFR